jgi:hypothetical protein
MHDSCIRYFDYKKNHNLPLRRYIKIQNGIIRFESTEPSNHIEGFMKGGDIKKSE